jgi:hypothetical protein
MFMDSSCWQLQSTFEKGEGDIVVVIFPRLVNNSDGGCNGVIKLISFKCSHVFCVWTMCLEGGVCHFGGC